MIKKIAIAVVVLMLGCCLQAQAAVIVDTGDAGSAPSGNTWSLYHYQWLAAEFSLGQATTITDVYGWIANYTGGTASLAIYADGGETPVSAPALFSANFNVVASELAGGADWHGASGLSWDLDAGTYWASFESRPNDTYNGGMPSPSANPLVNEAYWYGSNWYAYDDLNFGVKILGNAGSGPVVPEPASMILMGIGLAGAAMRRRKRA